MPSGLRVDIDPWVQDFQDAKQLADEIVSSIQERNSLHRAGGSEASRMTAAARRKLGILGTKVDRLEDLLSSSECANISSNERNRRQDLITVLRSRKDQMTKMLSRNQAERESLMRQTGSSSSAPAQETERTAELDSRGLVQLQQQVMNEQDEELEQLSSTVTNTKHIALAINEELDLQNSLLDEFEEDVEVTHSRLRAAKKRVAQVLKKSNNCKCFMVMVMLVMVLMIVLAIGFKFFHL